MSFPSMRSDVATRSKQSEKIQKHESFRTSKFEHSKSNFNSKKIVPSVTSIAGKVPQRRGIHTVNFNSGQLKKQCNSTDTGLAHVDGRKTRLFKTRDSTLTKKANETHLTLERSGTNLLNAAEELDISEEYLSMRDYIND